MMKIIFYYIFHHAFIDNHFDVIKVKLWLENYLSAYPEYQLMTRFMYPNPRLRKVVKR